MVAFSGIVLFPESCLATDKVNLWVTCDCKDVVGAGFCFKFKEKIRESVTFRLIDGRGEVSSGIGVHLRSLDPVDYDSQLAGHVSTLGIAFTFGGVKPGEIYADSSLMEVGEESVDVMVTSLLNDVENLRVALAQPAKKQEHLPASP